MNEQEKPDLDVLIWKGVPDNFDSMSLDERHELIIERNQEYLDANWWNWSSDEWKKYFEWRRRQRVSLGDEYSFHEYERVLLEFGLWTIKHSDEIDQKRLVILRSMIGDYLFYWRYGEESPNTYE